MKEIVLMRSKILRQDLLIGKVEMGVNVLLLNCKGDMIKGKYSGKKEQQLLATIL